MRNPLVGVSFSILLASESMCERDGAQTVILKGIYWKVYG